MNCYYKTEQQFSQTTSGLQQPLLETPPYSLVFVQKGVPPPPLWQSLVNFSVIQFIFSQCFRLWVFLNAFIKKCLCNQKPIKKHYQDKSVLWRNALWVDKGGRFIIAEILY